MKYIGCAIIFFIFGMAVGADAYGHDVYDAKVIRVVDGDTFEAVIELGLAVSYTSSIRVKDLDTPETWRPKSEAERTHGNEATSMAAILLEGQEIQLNITGRDRYGRVVAEVILPDGRNFKEVMIKNGLQKRESY